MKLDKSIQNTVTYALTALVIGSYAIKAETNEKTDTTSRKPIQINLEQRTIDSLVALGDSTYVQKNDYTKAMQYFNQALQINPSDVEAINGLAYMHYNLNNYNEALKLYDKGLKLNPTHVVMLYNRSFIRKKLGDTKGAQEDYDRCMESIMKGKGR